MKSKNIAIAGASGALEHLTIGQALLPVMVGYDHELVEKPVGGDYFIGDVQRKPNGGDVKGAAVMAVVDSAGEASLCILQRDGTYYVSLCDETLVWDINYPMRGAFLIWILSQGASERIVFDPYSDGNTGAYTYELMYSAGLLSAITMSQAETTTRLNSNLGGISSLLTLATKNVQVGLLGGLVLSPIPHLTASAYSMAHRPFLIELYQRAVSKGLLLPDECSALIDGSSLVALSRTMLLDRGAQAI